MESDRIKYIKTELKKIRNKIFVVVDQMSPNETMVFSQRDRGNMGEQFESMNSFKFGCIRNEMKDIRHHVIRLIDSLESRDIPDQSEFEERKVRSRSPVDFSRPQSSSASKNLMANFEQHSSLSGGATYQATTSTASQVSTQEDLFKSTEPLLSQSASSSQRTDTEIPSQITAKKWLNCGVNQILDNPFAGKWMIFLDDKVKDSEGLTKLDKAWLQVKSLVLEGVLILATCSTAQGHSQRKAGDNFDGVISCYNTLFYEINTIQKCAEDIKKATNYSKALYYKTVIESSPEKYGNKDFSQNTSLYRLSVLDGGLSVRNEFGSWIRIEPGRSLQELIPGRLKTLMEQVMKSVTIKS